MTEEVISWDEALSSANYVKFETDKKKTIVLTNHRLERRPDDDSMSPGEIEFIADCTEEDGKAVEKTFNTTSKRLKTKLRPIFENKGPTDITKLSIIRVGEQFNTQYSVIVE